MIMNSTVTSILIIAVTALVTFITRALPFVLFSNKRRLPKKLLYLGTYLPLAVMAVLVVYCFKDSLFTGTSILLAQGLAVAAVVILHVIKRNNLLSIGAGTIIYMILIRIL